jgi:hypothetical protein
MLGRLFEKFVLADPLTLGDVAYELADRVLAEAERERRTSHDIYCARMPQ